MVCGNCFITPTPKDCIIDGSTSDDNTNMVNVISLSHSESSDYGVISVTDDDDYGGLPTILEAPGSGSWGELRPSEETVDSQPTSKEASRSETPQVVLLQQVMMTKPVGTTAGSSALNP